MTASASAVAALNFGIAYLAGITAIIGTMTCGAMVGATALGAAVITFPYMATIYFATKFNFIPGIINFIAMNCTLLIAAITGAAILGMAITPVAICASISIAISLTIKCIGLASYYLFGDNEEIIEYTETYNEPSSLPSSTASTPNSFFSPIEENDRVGELDEVEQLSNIFEID